MKKIVVAIAVLLFAGGAAWFFGLPAYRHYRETQAATMAKQFLAKCDYRNASICARQALGRNPRNLSACEVMAELSEVTRSPLALDWYRRICEINPAVTNKLAFAGAALRFQGAPFPIAKQLLSEIGAGGAPLPAFHVLSAEMALKTGNMPEAIAAFEKALQLEPANELHRLNLAVLQLQSSNTAVAALGKSSLEALQNSKSVGAVALRWLVANRLAANDLEVAQQLSSRLIDDPRASLADRLQHLDILRQRKDPEFSQVMITVQAAAATNGVSAAMISGWMLERKMDARAWLSTCTNLLEQPPVRLALVDCYLAQRNWDGLETFLQKDKWGELDFLRMGFLSLAAEKQNEPAASQARWKMAVRDAGDRLGAMTRLLSMAATWGRESATEELLWQIAQRFPREQWAFRELGRIYSAGGNTRGLNRLYARLADQNPKDLVARNNLAATSLLLNVNAPEAHQIARALHSQAPDDPVITSTYAYSLHLQGRTAEGLAAMEKLKAEDLGKPSISLYYGLLLAGSGDTQKAAKYLDSIQSAELLPEEKILVAQWKLGASKP